MGSRIWLAGDVEAYFLLDVCVLCCEVELAVPPAAVRLGF